MKFIVYSLLFISGLISTTQDSVIYEQDFTNDSAKNDFIFTDNSAWRVNDNSLELFGKSEYAPPHRSPLNIGLLKTRKVGSFTLEADLLQTGREYGHRDMCIFFGFQNSSQFYYIHIASIPDPNAHNVFIVNNAARSNIAVKTSDGIDWGGGWHKIRLERNIESGDIRLFFDDMTQPIMEANDTSFGEGYIGFGSFDDTGRIDNIRLWGQASATDLANPFK